MKRTTLFVAAVLTLLGISASADVVTTNTGLFAVSTDGANYSYVTNLWYHLSGYSEVRGDVNVDGNSYMRIGLKANLTPAHGMYLAPEASDKVAFTVGGGAGTWFTYRDSSSPAVWVQTGIDPVDTVSYSTRINVHIGKPGAKNASGRAGFVLNAKPNNNFGGNISSLTTWGEYLQIEPSAQPHESGYIDAIQLNGTAIADWGYIVNRNPDYPVRLLFNGTGYIRHNQSGVDRTLSHYKNYPYDFPPYGQLVPFTNAVIVLEGTNKHDIVFHKCYFSVDSLTDYTTNLRRINSGMGTVRFQGNCNVQLYDDGNCHPGTSGSNRAPFVLDPAFGPVEWNQTGDIIIAGSGWLLTMGDDMLPAGANSQTIRLRDGTIRKNDDGSVMYYTGGVLDPDGHTVYLRSLIKEGKYPSACMVTNMLADYQGRVVNSKLVFGTGNTDGIFAAECCGNIDAEKVGSGTLVVSNVTMKGTLTIKEGKVCFVGDNYFAQPVVLEEGVEVIELTDSSADTIKILDDRVPQHIGDVNVRYEQTTTNDVYMYGGDFTENVIFDIRKGKLMFTGTVQDEYWKLTVKTAMGVNDGLTNAYVCELNAFGLWPTNISKAVTDLKTSISYGISSNKTWTAPSSLIQGKCTEVPNGIKWTTGVNGRTWFGPDAVFDNGPATCWQVTKNEDGTTAIPKLEVTNSWYSVAFRLPANSLPAASFSPARDHWGHGIGAWILSSSTSGKDDSWVVRHEHLVQWVNTTGMTLADADRISEYPHCDDKTPGGTEQKESLKWYNNGKPYRFNHGGTASETVQGIRAIIADGAIMDTDYIGDDYLSFAALDIDLTAGAGTITKFSPGENGVLYLSNLPTGTSLRNWRELPIDISSFVHVENLSSWNVYLDGELQKGVAVVVMDGKLCLKHSYGIYLNFR